MASAAAVPTLALASSAVAQDVGAFSNRGRRNFGRPLPELYQGWNSRNFREIMDDENAHIETISKILGDFGGAVPPAPNFNEAALEQPTYRGFANLSQVFENTGVRAYLGALPYIQNNDLKTAAGSIAEIEAYHSGYLNTLLNTPIAPNRENFAIPATEAEIVQAVSPFIVNLNSSLPMISTTPSAANDITILQFALILERLEQRFYNINVPKFY